ncbi:MAG: hypothetical protein QOC98_1130, partial [Frankiaceae bacterium]|nr:hypothetical protein [Frankiaceae bacterium]
TSTTTSARALAYPALVGDVAAGDRVLVNTSAVALGLGTGGFHLVVAVLDRTVEQRAAVDPHGPGHLVKARYTPLQAIVLGVDEEASPHRAAMAATDDLDGHGELACPRPRRGDGLDERLPQPDHEGEGRRAAAPGSAGRLQRRPVAARRLLCR